jgi:uncharacterized protein YndB with AHSA1/START domain
MLMKILAAAVAVVAILAIVIATRPSTFSVTRSRTVAAPAAAVYAQVADFHRWAAWSPWERLDPAMQKTFSGPPSGPGAIYAWKGNKQVGEGRMTITGATPDAQVAIRLEFIEPFAQVSDTTFTFAPQGAGTQVTWNMSGPQNFLSKAFSMVMDMDKMIGGDFERGLAGLATAAEAPVAVPASAKQ